MKNELELARERIKAFRTRFDKAHLYLAYHAAFPLALTPEFLNYLWQAFDRDIAGRVLNIPWVAISDVLLSDLCVEIGSELYEMRPPERKVLLDALRAHPRFGDQRLLELSSFLQEYIREQLGSADLYTRNRAETQKWTALAVAEPSQAAEELARALKTSIEAGNVGEQLRLAAVVDVLADSLRDYQPLIDYIHARRDVLQAVRSTVGAGPPWSTSTSTVVAGIELPPPAEKLRDPVERQIGPPPTMPPYIFGIAGLGAESVLLEAGKPGWIVVTLTVNRTGTPDDFSALENQGIGVIVVLVNSFGSAGTIPPAAQYDQFAAQCAEVVRRSSGARIWVIGNEPNHDAHSPGVDLTRWKMGGASDEPITPPQYARCFNKCRQAIRTLPGHENDWVIPAAIAPSIAATAYPGNPTGNWVQYFADMLKEILAQGGTVDGIALHARTPGGYDPQLITSEDKDYRFINLYREFRTYRDFMAAIPPALRNLPVLITAAQPSDRERTFERTGWLPAAFFEINAWNLEPSHQPIQALCVYQSYLPADPSISGFERDPQFLADLRVALQNEYRVRLPGAAQEAGPPAESARTRVAVDDYAVIIGIGHYPSFGTLEGAEEDAAHFAGWLMSQEGGNLPAENVFVLLSRDYSAVPDPVLAGPSREDVDRPLYTLVQAMRDRKRIRRLYLYVSGFCLRRSRDDDIVLLLANANRLWLGANFAIREYLQFFRLSGLVEELVFFADCARLEMSNDFPVSPPPWVPTRTAEARPARTFYAYYEALEHTRGYFTASLLEGLRGSAADAQGRVTSSSLRDYISYRMAQLSGEPVREPEFLFSEEIVMREGVTPPVGRVLISVPPELQGKEVTLFNGSTQQVFRGRLVQPETELFLAPGLYSLQHEGSGDQKLFRVIGGEEPVRIRLPGGSSIAVLHFVNLSGDPEQEYFSDGMTEDLITELATLPGLFVVSRDSVFTYKGKAVKPEQLRQELGVRYLLEGSVRKANDRVQIAVRLVDTTTGYQLWADRYDRVVYDRVVQGIFAVLEEIARRIAMVVSVALTPEGKNRVEQKDTDNVEARELFMRGTELYRRFTKQDNAQAREQFEQAIRLDPTFARAYAMLAATHRQDWTFAWTQDRGPSEELAYSLARKAVELSRQEPEPQPSLPYTLEQWGFVLLYRRRHQEAIAAAEEAVQRNPNYADGYALGAQVLIYRGKPEEALRQTEEAIRLNPTNPFYDYLRGQAYYVWGFLTTHTDVNAAGQYYQEAETHLRQALERNMNYSSACLYLVAVLEEIGRYEEAKMEMAKLRDMGHPQTVQNFIWFKEYINQAHLYEDPEITAHLIRVLQYAE